MYVSPTSKGCQASWQGDGQEFYRQPVQPISAQESLLSNDQYFLPENVFRLNEFKSVFILFFNL
jgi:hypothetical protein